MQFGILFEVAMLHDYWLNLNAVVHEALSPQRQIVMGRQHDPGNYFEIVPTAATRALLAGHGMVFKKQSTGFLVGIELEGTGTVPRHLLRPNAVLTFTMRVVDPLFFNYTADALPQFHRFTNTTTNEHDGQLILSQPVPAHQATRIYRAGEIRSVANGNITSLFQAISDTGPSPTPVAADWQRIPADTHDPTITYQRGAIVLQNNELFRALINSPGTNLNVPTQWSNEGSLANQYVTRDDALNLRPEVFSVDVTSAAATILELRVTRPGSTTPVWQHRFESGQNLTSLQANLRGLRDGAYRLDVLDSAMVVQSVFGFDFYLSNQAVIDNWFGVIEIHPGTGNFALLDGSDQLRSPRFDLRFLNLASRWRYLFPVTQPTGTGAEVVADPVDDSILVTPTPRPLTRVGNGVRLRADDATTPAVSEQILLPQPGVRTVRKLNNQWFSEVHLSNFPTLS